MRWPCKPFQFGEASDWIAPLRFTHVLEKLPWSAAIGNSLLLEEAARFPSCYGLIGLYLETPRLALPPISTNRQLAAPPLAREDITTFRHHIKENPMAGPPTSQPNGAPRPQTTSATVNEDLLLQALQEADAELPDAEQEESSSPVQEPPTQHQGPTSIIGKGINAWKSVGAGMVNAAFETKDFVFGEPEQGDKSEFRQLAEKRFAELKGENVVNSAAFSISQMVTGLLGAGKIMKPVKALQKVRQGSTAGKIGYEVGRGALASTVVLDPHEERLSDLIEEFPALQNPVTDYLSSDPEDSTAEGRFKNAIESIGLDFALVGAVKAIKLLKAGKKDEALKEIAKLETGTQAPDADAVLPLGADRKAQAAARMVEEPGAQRQAASETPPGATEASPAISSQSAEIAPTAAPGVREASPQRHRPTELSDDDLRTILKGVADEDATIRKFGSKEAASEAGQVLSRISSLPWQKLRGTEEVLSFVNRSAKVLKTQMDTANGGAVMSDARVSEMVQARAELFGEDPLLVMGKIQEAGEAARGMVATMEASYLVANRMFQETYDAAFRLRNGILDEWGGDAVRAEKELKDRLMASADLLANARAMSSNSGRALRRMRGQFQFKPEDLAKVKNLDGAKLADLITQTQGDPKKLAQMANPTFLSRVLDEATFSLTNSLLWLWPTHVTNITSSVIMLAGRPTEKLIGSMALGPKQGGDIIRQRAIKEYAYTVASLGDAWTAMKDAFLRGDSILAPHDTEFFSGGGTIRTAQQPLPWKPVTSITDLAHNAWISANYRNIVGLPTRALGAVDEFFKTLRYRAYVQAEASSAGMQRGLKGADLQQYIRQKMEEAIDPATGQALDQKALQEAQVTTFQQELLKGTAGASVQQARAQHPVLTFIVPFVKTPVNVLRYGWKMTPGLNLIQKEFRDSFRGVKGAEAKAHAIGQMALGTAFMGLAATLSLNGRMTGGGPKDAKLQQELRATGWQPYSYVIEKPDGSKKYLPMGRLDPASMSMAMMADLVEALRHEPENPELEVGIGALALALGKNFSDRTFLQNLHQALEALSDDTGDKGERYLASIAGNTIPISSALRGVNPDPYLREARSFIDMTLKNLPGYSQTLPPTRDAFGEPVARRIGLSTTQSSDVVEAENVRMMLETGRGVGKPDPKFEGVDLRDITLESGQNAYDRLQELGGDLPHRKPLKDYLAKLIQSRFYQNMPDGDSDVKGTRLHAIGKLVGQYRMEAQRKLVTENPELRAFIKARQKEARGAILKNREAETKREPGAQELLKALGR